MPNSHKSPHQIPEQIREVYRRVNWWPVLGIAIIVLGGYTYLQISQLSRAVGALSIALTAEQNDKRSKGESPVAPPPKEIVDNPRIIPGQAGADGQAGIPGVDGEDGEDGRDGRDGVSPTLPPLEQLKGEKGDRGNNGSTPTLPPSEELRGLPGTNGKDGTNGTNGKDGKDGTNGTNGLDGKNGEPPGSWTWEMGALRYTCSRVPDFNPNDPQYTCVGTPIVGEEPNGQPALRR